MGRPLSELSLEELMAERAKVQQARDALRAMKQVKRTTDIPKQAVSNISGMAVDAALLEANVPEEAKILNPRLVAPPADQQERLRQVSDSTGGRSYEYGKELSRDLEGVRGDTQERVSGDQRLIVDETGNALATREEYPAIGEHAKALVTGGPTDASFLGLLGNAFGTLVRPTATAFNYMKSDDPSKDVTNLPRDLWEAARNEKGHTVAEGGMVATRGSGFGDAMRVAHRDIMAGRGKRTGLLGDFSPAAGTELRAEDATLGDLMRKVGLPPKVVDGWLDAYPYIKRAAVSGVEGAESAIGWAHGVAQENLDKDKRTTEQMETELRAKFDPSRKIADIDPNDPVFDSFGELVGTFADPGNFVGLGEAGKVVSAVAKKVPVVGRPVAKVVDTLFVDDITKRWSPEAKLERALEKQWVASGMDPIEAKANAKKVAADRYDEEAGVRAEGAMENVEQQRLLEDAASKMRAKDAPVVRQLLEGGDANVPVLVDKSDMQQLADLHAAASRRNFDGLSSREADLLRKYTPGTAPTDELLYQRQRLADKLGVDVFEDHAWLKGNTEQVNNMVAAKSIGRALRRNLEIDQSSGLLEKHLRTKGYMPHAPRAELPVKMERAGVPKVIAKAVENVASPFLKKLGYNPRARREMAALGDVEVLRRAAIVAVDDMHRAGQVPPPFLVKFARHQQLADPKKGHWPKVGNRNDPNAVIAVRQELERQGVMVDAPLGTVDEAQRLAEHKGAHGRGQNADVAVNFEHDPIKAAAAYRNAMSPEQMQAGIGTSVSNLRDASDKPIVQNLMEAILTPRYGDKDHLLIHKMRTDHMGPERALYDDQGGLIYDVGNYLKNKGLVHIGADEAKNKLSMPALAGKVVPKAIYDDILKVAPRMTPGVIEKFAKVMSQMTNIWVPTVLNTPGFHIRNAFFGMFQVWLAVGPKMLKPDLWHAAGKVAAAAEKGGLAHGTVKLGGNTWNIADLVEEVQQLGIHEGGRVADLEGAVSRGMMPYKDEWARDLVRRINPFNATRGVITKEPLAKKLVSRGIGTALGMGQAGGTAENVQRIMIHLSKRADGMSARSSAREVVKYMFDYTGARLGPGEKTLRRFMPFYQWVKQSMLLTVDQLLKQPGKFVAVDHLYKTIDAFSRDSNQDPRHVPDYMRQRGAIATPFGEDKPGSRSMMMMERPGTQASWMLEPLLRADIGGGVNAAAQQLNPLATSMIERATGEYVFGDREIDENYTPEMSGQWTAKGIAERAAGMSAENIPGYLGKKWAGGYPSVGLEGILGLINPELVSKNPRFDGVDNTERMRNRLTSMLMGVQPVQTDAEAMALRAGKDVAEMRKKQHNREVEATKRRR